MSKNLVFMLGLVACWSTAQSQALSTEAWHAVADSRGVQLVYVECGSGVFDPREIVVKSNMPVELAVRASEPLSEFVSVFGPSKPIGNQRTAHRFTPTVPGHFNLLCQKQGEGEGPAAKARNTGVLTVVPGNASPRSQ